MRRDRFGQEAIERGGRHAPVPDRVTFHDRRHQPVEPLAAVRRQRNDRHAFDLRQQTIGILAQPRPNARLSLDQVHFVDADDDCAALPLDQVGDANVLLLERRCASMSTITTSAKRIALSVSATESFSSFSTMRERRRRPAVS